MELVLIDPEHADTEEVLLQGLVPIAAAVLAATRHHFPDQEPLTDSTNKPTQVPTTNFRDNQSRPDGHFVLKDRRSESKDELRWMDIAICGAYERQDNVTKSLNDVRVCIHVHQRGSHASGQNIRTAIWNMHHTMREDPHRRFTYGYTIENRTVRIWFSSRAEVIVSSSFDFMTVRVSGVSCIYHADSVAAPASPHPTCSWRSSSHSRTPWAGTRR